MDFHIKMYVSIQFWHNYKAVYMFIIFKNFVCFELFSILSHHKYYLVNNFDQIQIYSIMHFASLDI